MKAAGRRLAVGTVLLVCLGLISVLILHSGLSPSSLSVDLDPSVSIRVSHVHLSEVQQPQRTLLSENLQLHNAKITAASDSQRSPPAEPPTRSKFFCASDGCRILVYSAHVEGHEALVKIVGLRHKQSLSSDDQLSCVFNEGSITHPLTTLHNLSNAEYRHGVQYDAWVWGCKWRGKRPPYSLSLVSKGDTHKVPLPISVSRDEEGELLVCVKPMMGEYGDRYQLTEFLEMNRLLGVDKVALYPYQINSTLIQPILAKYVQQGLLDIHEWSPPVEPSVLHAGGQKSHNQHCLYTYRRSYRWIAFFDLDELIVPGTPYRSLKDMLKKVENEKQGDGKVGDAAAGYNVRSRMCPTVLPDDRLYLSGRNTPRRRAQLCELTSMRKTNCTPALDMGIWSKPVVIADRVEVVDIHSVKLPRAGYKAVDLDAEKATVHHYRNNMAGCVIIEQSTWRNERVTSLHRFMEAADLALPELCRTRNPLAV